MQMVIALTISSPGLKQQDQIVLQSAISQLTQAGRPFQLLNHNVGSAQLLVLDDDSEGGRTLLQRSRSGQVKLVLSSNPKMGKNIIGIKKPLDLSKLIVLLTRVFEKMQIQLAGRRQRQPIEVADAQSGANHSAEAGSQHALEQTLFGVLLDAKTEELVLRVSAPKCAEILIDGINRSIATKAPRDSLHALLKKSRDQLWIEQLLSRDFETHSNGLNITPLYSTLWTAAIECSQGQILPGHDPGTPVKLRAWPNFTRSDFRAEHLKLAAVLARQATPLNQLQALTQVPYGDIVNFYNAAVAVDIIDVNPAENTPAPVEKTVTQQMKNLFNRIAQRLSFG